MRIYQVLTVSLIVLLACSTNNTPTFEVSVTVDPPEAGSVISTPSESVADKGTSISLRAEANEGWVFGNWGGDINSTNNPTTFTLDSDKSIVANFEEKKYPLSINIVGEGEVTEQVIALPKSADYLSGTIVRLTAVPAEDWLFQGWAEFPDSSEIIDLVITEATSVTVTFKSDFWKRLDNGVTITCSKAAIGETGIIDGVEYTKRTRDQITVENAATTCTSGIEDMSLMFYYKEGFNEDISHWDVSSVTDMNEMFYNTKSFNHDISEWDVRSVTNMTKMLHSNELFNQDISKWDVSSVTDMAEMFSFTPFNQVISNWDVTSVINMYGMFYNAWLFNQGIGSWDVSSVNNLDYMFYSADAFNQNLSKWCVSYFTSEPNRFSEDSPLTEENKPKWGTCPSN